MSRIGAGLLLAFSNRLLGLTMPAKRVFSEFADSEHERQATELLLELGRFSVAFERVCEAMRYAVLWIFQSEGLKHQGLSQVVIGDKGSVELQVLLGALFAELQERYDDADRRAVNNVLKDVKALTEERNVVIHSAWRFGNNAAFAELYATTIRPRTKQKQGAVPEVHGLSAKSLFENAVRLSGEVFQQSKRSQFCSIFEQIESG